ncbi:flagellar basal body-associated protein FliL [Thalassococcus lentus]|uniref:Flagellar basal body-associated protein FliL n=1 Tax=Thalassococcus lentus TaxID=1210524 RepID=A0ABT4XN07_9RHOB|nr:flagellar basal body-associated protein FliL [Thalassococcus lentus]MDA7423331.1 flagellar basal body-associated protein FliL [Thalassococcus lentus]
MLKLFPILLAILGTGAGVGAGLYLKPDKPQESEQVVDEKPDEKGKEEPTDTTEFVKLNNQFVIPVVGPERVNALVVLSLSIEVKPGQSQSVYSQEPKLRDEFLQVLFDHANIGGFDGSFTKADRMEILRNALQETATAVLGDIARGVLITEIARQDG